MTHSETVLLVRDDKTEILKFNIILNQSVSADNQVNFAGCKPGFDFTFFRGSDRACEQGGSYVRIFEKFTAGCEMLSTRISVGAIKAH